MRGDDIQAKLEEALAGRDRLRDEVGRLKEALSRHGIRWPEAAPHDLPQLSPTRKIELFRSLFRGREDVYAERWEGRDGKAGYAPACEKDWNALLRVPAEDRKKVHKQTRKLLPLTDKAIRLHLTGEKTIGIFPLLTDETCWFLAADFDKASWREDSAAFVTTCRQTGIPAYIERSRSGNGGHVWVFFERAIPAVLARKLGCAILTQTMEYRHQLGLSSYDRFFPNQDTLPKGGFGNLIALPLQKIPRDNGNSVFVDDSFQAHPDQWQFLAAVQRATWERIESVVNDAARTGRIVGVRASVIEEDIDEEPWTVPPSGKRTQHRIQGPFPERVELVRSNLIYVSKAGLPEAMLNRLIRLAAFQNPEFYKAQTMRLSTWGKPRVISCAEEFSQHIGLPRGCLVEVEELLEAHGVRLTYRDERSGGCPIDVVFRGNLSEEQADAVAKVTKHEEGILCAPTAFGKTVAAAKLIALRGVNTLVLVHRQQLLDQWRVRLATFLDLSAESIGQVGGGKTAPTDLIDVALLQSVQRKGVVKDLVAEYGHVIVDECHHLSAFTFEQVMKQVKARYVLGPTATPTRKDGHHPIVFMECGPIRFSLSAREAASRSPFEHVVVPRPTDYQFSQEAGDVTIQQVYAALASDEKRNQQIVADILGAIRNGLTPLVLTNRTEHLDRLAAGLTTVENVLVLKGRMGRKQRQAAADRLNSIPEGVPRVILATGSYIGEGFDDSRLDTLFLTMPISWRGTLQQYVGRLHRIHQGKRVVRVYDYVDGNVPMLARMYERRLKGYSAIGYVIDPTRL